MYRSENERNTYSPPVGQSSSKEDAMLILPLILLLMTEKADKTLLFALLYILM